jgi:Fe2+ transport system protein FeoA
MPVRDIEGTALAASTTLDRLERSSEAVVAGLECSPTLRRRLLEAGFVTGSRVRFLMATPFGDPLVFSLRGASIALRRSEARCVRVRY